MDTVARLPLFLREARRLSWDHDDGVAAALSREDAIDATAVSLTRRDGRSGPKQLKLEKKPPTSSCGGHESYE